MTGRFIVLEGLDGSGKSTTARLLASALGARSMTTPSERLRRVRGAVVEALASPVARQTFYLATVEEASEEIRGLRDAGVDVVLDRYLLSKMAYAEQRGDAPRWTALEDRLLPADFTFFLDLPYEVRRSRVLERGATAADRETLDPLFDQGVRARYRSWSKHRVARRYFEVRLAGDETPEEVVALVLEHIRATTQRP